MIINIRLVASCWFLSLHPTFMMHGHKNLKKIGMVNSYMEWAVRKFIVVGSVSLVLLLIGQLS